MQRSPNDSSPSDRRFLWNWTAGILAVHGVIVLALVGLILSYPAASTWISQAVQAEFVGKLAPVTGPTQIARPGTQMQTVTADYSGQVDPPSHSSAWSAAEVK
ncbi:hypothetical protein [Bradyrhizobium sp.]|uniref:hypothetical protein n=1 Tax=Bradyrhizobium sp. TaxID=376 RepID=UPI003BB083A8